MIRPATQCVVVDRGGDSAATSLRSAPEDGAVWTARTFWATPGTSFAGEAHHDPAADATPLKRSSLSRKS